MNNTNSEMCNVKNLNFNAGSREQMLGLGRVALYSPPTDFKTCDLNTVGHCARLTGTVALTMATRSYKKRENNIWRSDCDPEHC
jgi:hypothetical protein